eukprot:COSAG02_NODE_56367_length_286_cov_0.443850_1_plen_29_part_10
MWLEGWQLHPRVPLLVPRYSGVGILGNED